MTEEMRELFARLEAWWDAQCPLPMCGDCRESVLECQCKPGEA